MVEFESYWLPAYIGIGSNLNEPASQVRIAFKALSKLADTRLICVSPLYKNPPMGPQNQPDYVNAVAGLITQLKPIDLLNAMKSIELKQGRIRKSGDRWEARIIDLDLLIYGSLTMEEDELKIPHSGIRDRNFVLFPLLNIAPNLNVVGYGSVAELAKKFTGTSIERLEE
ncbi:MAG: 2-amino-4-hydroxy-6-hydroxymethyldihydropteridine diphosphokinase [Pseudomonadota bacterium]|nr:2-amino-4-hydroxy-6-hydroxymethyldihydropteridine diphosphokinase [Pseudomonadota bacterium]